MRRAIAMAIDRRSAAEESGLSPAGGGLIPPGMPGHTPGLALPYDPEQTRRLLAEAGYRDDKPLRLRVRTFESVLGPFITRSLPAVLPAELDSSGIIGEFPLEHHGSHLLVGFWGADLPDPDNFLRHSTVLTASLRKTGWQDPELDALLERAAHTTDRAARMAMYRQADRRLVVEQALVVPLTYGETSELLSQPWVHGVRQNKMGILSLEEVVVEKHAGASGYNPRPASGR